MMMTKGFTMKLGRIENIAKRISGFSLWIWLIFIFLAGIKLFLVGGQHEYAIGFAGHDDRLFINLAVNLMHFEWLGDFNNLTLIKGPFYPIWIVFTHISHIPLLVSEHLLYAAACIILILGLKPIFKRNWPLLIIYAVVLFNPVSFANGPATRVIRDGLYQPLTLLFVSLSIGLVLRLRKKSRKLFLWSGSAGLILSALWLTREEGVWLLPFLAIVMIYSIFSIWREGIRSLKKKLLIIFMPLIILFFSINILSAINYYEYGIYNVVELKTPEFLSAYGAMTRVKGDQWIRDVPVSTQKRLEIYPFSPTFSKLKPFFEGDLGTRWTSASVANSEKKGVNEIKGGWFLWAFRDAVAQAGYYSDGNKVLNFYQKMADEINSACNQKKLDCYPKRASMTPPWNNNYNEPLKEDVLKSIAYVSKLQGFSATPAESTGDDDSLRLFSSITYERTSSEPNDSLRLGILNFIGKLYRLLLPTSLLLAVVTFLLNIFKKNVLRNVSWIICFSLAVAILSRIALLSIINTTSFYAIDILYFSPMYSLILLFILLNLLSITFWTESKIIGKNYDHES